MKIRKKIVFFLPNGIGDLLMAIPALRRLIDSIEPNEVIVIVSNQVHTNILNYFIGSNIKIICRYDKLRFSQMRLWLKLFNLRADYIFAPLISKKLINKFFLISLFSKAIVPNNFIQNNFFFRLQPSSISLGNFKGHQTHYYLHFLAGIVKNIRLDQISPDEMRPNNHKIIPKKKLLLNKRISVVIGVSCGEVERHKIPSSNLFSQLINQLANTRELDLIFLGAASDMPLIEDVRRGLIANLTVKLLIDQPINILIEEIQKCNIGIAGTTGQGHIMAAADLPMLVLAGVTNPYQSGPYASRVALLLHRYICGPCYQENFRFGCKKVNCMDTLDISEGVRLANLLADDLEFGKYWMKKSLGSHAIPVEMINTIQLLPMGEWVYKDKNSK